MKIDQSSKKHELYQFVSIQIDTIQLLSSKTATKNDEK